MGSPFIFTSGPDGSGLAKIAGSLSAMRRRIRTFVPLALVALASAGCGETTKSVATSECSSGTRWIGDDAESPEMHPGMDCIGCHAAKGEGPRFTIAGTVYGGPNAGDDCFGLGGITVRLVGADGVATELATNGAGNFFTGRAVKAPYTAELVRAGSVVAKMQTPQSSGACNACHRAEGTPGRILAP